jgi:ppGpp synthetase/RelA/SpoT-type nucleotidyltranferase
MCRVVVPDVAEQNDAVAALTGLFPDAIVVDRRTKPSFGYRAVHIIVTIQALRVEVQVRTSLQQKWAELSEKMSDVIDPSVKYGGNKQIQPFLRSQSSLVARIERLETRIVELPESEAKQKAEVELRAIKRELSVLLARQIDETRRTEEGNK